MIHVYHNPHFLELAIKEGDVLVFAVKRQLKELEQVATVFTNDLDEAFRLTNHIDKSWHENERVKVIKKSRSTSVGDVLLYEGVMYVVAPVGFLSIDGDKDFTLSY